MNSNDFFIIFDSQSKQNDNTLFLPGNQAIGLLNSSFKLGY